MFKVAWFRWILISAFFFFFNKANAFLVSSDTLAVSSVEDFEVDGAGKNKNWEKAAWVALKQLDNGPIGYDTRFKVLYSAKGLYVLFNGKDKKNTSSFNNDFDDLFKADVFEVFLHPDPSTPLYFEYEISPFEKELVLLIPNLQGKFMGWRPWHYEGDRLVKKKVSLSKDKDQLISWSAELFFPYSLLHPLPEVPPQKGSYWHANFYRLDYDDGPMIKWSWSPIEKSFHEINRFGVLKFG